MNCNCNEVIDVNLAQSCRLHSGRITCAKYWQVMNSVHSCGWAHGAFVRSDRSAGASCFGIYVVDGINASGDCFVAPLLQQLEPFANAR
jgi:hypothetical protein